MSISKKEYILAKKWSRYFLIQALYEWQITHNDIGVVSENFASNERFERADSEYFFEVLGSIVANIGSLNEQISPYLDRDIDLVDPVEKAILWLGVYELKEKLDLPYKVVINEALELAKKFGAEGSHRYINGVLDKVSRSLRA